MRAALEDRQVLHLVPFGGPLKEKLQLIRGEITSDSFLGNKHFEMINVIKKKLLGRV